MAAMSSALVIMDVQNGIVERYLDGAHDLLGALRRAAVAARSAEVHVIYVTIAFRPGAPEISPKNRTFSAFAASGHAPMADSVASEVHAELGRVPEDIVVTKKRVSAFAGSDLEVVLRSLGVDQLVLAGIATSGVVLSTLRQAADMDFGLTVLRDGCADPDEEVHRVLLDKVLARQAAVVTVDEWIAAGCRVA